MHSSLCTQIETLVMRSASTLDDVLADLLLTNGGRSHLDSEIQVFDILNNSGYSGYNYWCNNQLIGQIQFANLLRGGFVLYKRLYINNMLTEVYDLFDAKGNKTQSLSEFEDSLITYDLMTMEMCSPIVNHMYNILHVEYEKANTGSIRTKEVSYMEKFLNVLYKDSSFFLGVKKVNKDPALFNIDQEIFHFEEDEVLRWGERQEIFKKLRDIRQKLIDTKKRAHNLSYLSYNLRITFSDMKTNIDLIRMRPGSNMRGLLYKYTLGNLFWFVKTVRGNLGYSVALAIYGPFTFYFITQPMNPHAMWAVGKVRNAYIGMVNSVNDLADKVSFSTAQAVAVTDDEAIFDTVNVTSAATLDSLKLPETKESWEERMSKFKAMQIGYEGNMIFAARLGRIEQLENQYSFPLTVESLWHEIKRYENGLKMALSFNTNLDHRFSEFVNHELVRMHEYKFWALERLSQFYLDHPYIAVDQSNEQTQKDYYTGRGFILLKDIALELSQAAKGRDLPVNHSKIIELAVQYENERKQEVTIVDTLKKNSKLFAQKDVFNSTELRSYMKRHWEILFIQQNKAQEASSFGLQSYTWSARNALWIMQTIISAKREELPSLTYKFNLNNTDTSAVKSEASVSKLYESMLHFLVMEFTGVKKEIAEFMNDKEMERREEIINMTWKSFEERDSLYSIKLQAPQTKTANN